MALIINGDSPDTVVDTANSSLEKRVYYAARDGLAITLFAILAEQATPEQVNLLSTSVEENGQNCTPLLIAARNGHEKAIHTLVSKFKPNLEQTGTVRFNGYVIEGATPLWCAAGAGSLKIVKLLVKAGADVNHTTKTNSTPMRAACFEGRLDIVEYLFEHGADIDIANKFNNTCLMIAAYKGHAEVVEFLLSKGANPNVKANCGATALHFSAECGHIKIVKELLKHGAQLTPNEHGMTPLVSAAERCQEEVLEHLLTLEGISKEDTVMALELIGASFANDKDNYDISKAFKFLVRAMELRWEDPKDIMTKPVKITTTAYENWAESESLEDLVGIEHDHNALHMEGLTIRERILGRHNPEVPHPVVFRGAVFADSARFDRCIDLWLHALRLRQETGIGVMKDLLRFAQVYSQILHVGLQVEFENFSEVLTAAGTELATNMERAKNPGPKDDFDTIMEEMDMNMTTCLYLLVILTKMRPSLTEDQSFIVMKEVFRIIQLEPRSKNNRTLLHMAADSETVVDDFHTNDIVHFPCAATTKLLIEAGASAEAMDDDRNTPLHIIVGYQKVVSDFLTLHSIIMSLLDAGAHIDVVNAEGKTPMQKASTGVAEIILKSQARLSLKCMAAQMVKKHKISYQGQVPQSLLTFIELHGPM